MSYEIWGKSTRPHHAWVAHAIYWLWAFKRNGYVIFMEESVMIKLMMKQLAYYTRPVITTSETLQKLYHGNISGPEISSIIYYYLSSIIIIQIESHTFHPLLKWIPPVHFSNSQIHKFLPNLPLFKCPLVYFDFYWGKSFPKQGKWM